MKEKNNDLMNKLLEVDNKYVADDFNIAGLNYLSKLINKFITEEKGFYTPNSIHGKLNPELTTVKLALIITEISEAIEAVRKGDEENFKEEIADTFVRLFDLVVQWI